MVETAVAFSPGHISGYFRRVDGSSPAATGSVGAGVVIDDGVRATVSAADTVRVLIRRRDGTGAVVERTDGSPPVEYALKRLGVRAAVVTDCRLPIGAGFGLSAAALLATITAANHLFDLGMPGEEVAARAHEAEVVHCTGLGDVAACQGGGLACRRGPGIGAEIVRIPLREPLYAVTLGPLPTASVLSSPDAMERVTAAFPDRCPTDLEDFVGLSRTFAERSGLVSPGVRGVLRACDREGVPASMTMLGNGVFACGSSAGRVLSAFGEVFVLRAARRGVRLLEGCG